MTDTTTDTTGQPEDLTALVQKYFNSTNPAELQAALIAMVDRIDELEANHAYLRDVITN